MSSRWYPIYQRGNPQLRVFLPNFWMKLVKPTAVFGKALVPQNKVQFIVAGGMTKYDIKNYLEKIYNVPVANVRTVNKLGKTRRNDFADYLVKDDDQKIAFITLPPGHKFEWPDLKITESQDEKTEGAEEEIDNAKEQFAKDTRKEEEKYRPGVPSFFGL
jgi:large subunit ribosomal protein L23